MVDIQPTTTRPRAAYQRRYHYNRNKRLILLLVLSLTGHVSSFAHASFIASPSSIPTKHHKHIQQLLSLKKRRLQPQKKEIHPRHHSYHTSPCRLSMMLPKFLLPASVCASKNTASAAFTLLGSAATGYFCDAQLFQNGSGILVTLLLASILSNLGLAPSNHGLYDACWTTFLPASLALLLLSNKTANKKTNSQQKEVDGETTIQEIQRVAGPFWMGSLGSILGCCAAFATVKLPEAAMAAGCLCASYIGGSVNFFATANIVQSSGASGNSILLSSMAAADLVVMALYFLFLTGCMNSDTLNGWFAKQDRSAAENQNVQDGLQAKGDNRCMTTRQMVSAVSFAGVLALAIVEIAKRLENTVAAIVPGTACAVIAVLSVVVQQFMPHENVSWQNVQRVAEPMSEFSFHLLFAAIGTCANLVESLKYGPACLVFSLLALLVHVGFIFTGSFVLSRLMRIKIQMKHVLVASNAAIGGPATAATFAGRFKQEGGRGLVMAATTWGVVGYAVGTSIGVTLTRALQGAV